MIPRYTLPESAAIWSVQRRREVMLEIELLATEAQERLGEVPPGTAESCRIGAGRVRVRGFDADRIAALERRTGHEVVAFVTAVGEVIGPAARYMHRGLHGSDVLDMVLAVQLRDVGHLLLEELDDVLSSLQAQARTHAGTICIGRTHGLHAEPTTFGLKLSGHWDELRRCRVRLARAVAEVSVATLSGTTGTAASVDPFVEAHVCEGLKLMAAQACSPQVHRDRHAYYFQCLALLGTAVERFAAELRHLHQAEVLEVSEGVERRTGTGLPYRAAPVASETVTGMARMLRGYAQMAMDDVVGWYERDQTHATVERVMCPDATMAAHSMLRRLRGVVDGLVVRVDRMEANVHASGGLFAIQRVMVALVEAGMPREDAYATVHQHAAEVWQQQGGPEPRQVLAERLASDPQVTALLSETELAQLTDAAWFIRRADQQLDRAFGATSGAAQHNR